MYSSIWKRSTWYSSYRRSLDYSILEYAPVQRLSQVISGKQVCVYKMISSHRCAVETIACIVANCPTDSGTVTTFLLVLVLPDCINHDYPDYSTGLVLRYA